MRRTIAAGRRGWPERSTLVAAACGSDNTGSRRPPRRRPRRQRATGRRRRRERGAPADGRRPAEEGEAAAAVVHPGPVRRLLRRRRPGLLQGRRASTSRSSRAASTSCPQTVLADGQADFAIAWVPKALAAREAGRQHHRHRPDLPALGHAAGVASRTRTSPTPADFKGKKIGNWGFGNEFELFAGMTKAGLDPAKDVTPRAAALRHERPARAATSTPPRR